MYHGATNSKEVSPGTQKKDMRPNLDKEDSSLMHPLEQEERDGLERSAPFLLFDDYNTSKSVAATNEFSSLVYTILVE